MAPRNNSPDTESVYFVHPSESPNSLSITPKLTGSNYIAWSHTIERSLGTKNKLGFINGSIHMPDDDDLNRATWGRCNHLVQSWLINSVSDSIAQTIVFCDTTLEVWLDLKERFSKIDRIRIANLRSSINNLKQGSKSVLDYFTEMKSLWEELSSHRPIPNCACVHPCRCAASRIAKIHINEDQIMQFLTGLNDQFSIVRTQVLLLDPLLSLNKVYSLVVQEESNHASLIPLSVSEDASVQINATDNRKPQGRGKGFPQNKPSRFCTFCNRTNHTVDFCYMKHGYPNVNKSSPRVNAASQEDSKNGAISSSGLGASASSSSTGFSQEQLAQLVSMLQQSNLVVSAPSSSQATSNHIASTNISTPNPSAGISASVSSLTSKPSFWLIDSGVNEHICCDITSFSSFYRIKPVYVSLPNGNTVLAHFAGNVSFNSKFHLTHVLYSPHFTLNLISVAKCCDSLTCFFHFSLEKCLIQDQQSLKMIGLAKQMDGLCKFYPSCKSSHIESLVLQNSSCNAILPSHCNKTSQFVPDTALWHFRLGHLSHQRLHMMSLLYPAISINKNKDTYDLCHFAKHKQLPFTSSFSHASTNFELIHLDI